MSYSDEIKLTFIHLTGTHERVISDVLHLSEVAERHPQLVYFSKSHPTNETLSPISGIEAINVVNEVEKTMSKSRRKKSNSLETDQMQIEQNAIQEIDAKNVDNEDEEIDWDLLSTNMFPHMTGIQIEASYLKTIQERSTRPSSRESIYYSTKVLLSSTNHQSSRFGSSSSSSASSSTTSTTTTITHFARSIDDALILSTDGFNGDVFVTMVLNTTCFDGGSNHVTEGDRIVAVNGVCVSGCSANDILSLIQLNISKKKTTKGKDSFFYLTFARDLEQNEQQTNTTATISNDILRVVSTTASLRDDTERERASATYVGVTWMDVPGECQWRSAIRLDLDKVAEEGSRGSAVSVLGYYPTEKMAAQVFDTVARYQWGDRASTLINFSASSKRDLLKLQEAARNVHSWAQCEGCNKWRVLREKWKKPIFKCDMVLRSCVDPEDTQSKAAEILERHDKRKQSSLLQLGFKWLDRAYDKDVRRDRMTAATAYINIQELIKEGQEELPPFFPEAIEFLKDELNKCMEELVNESEMLKQCFRVPDDLKPPPIPEEGAVVLVQTPVVVVPVEQDDTIRCEICGQEDDTKETGESLMCGNGTIGCDKCYHQNCLNPRLEKIPDDDWFCSSCLAVEVVKKEKKVDIQMIMVKDEPLLLDVFSSSSSNSSGDSSSNSSNSSNTSSSTSSSSTSSTSITSITSNKNSDATVTDTSLTEKKTDTPTAVTTTAAATATTTDTKSSELLQHYRHSAFPALSTDEEDDNYYSSALPFDLPNAEFPVYGHRRGIMMVHDKFRCGPMAALVMRGYIHLNSEESAKLHSASLETTEDTAEWLRGIFLAEEADKDAYVFCYDGARRRMNQVKGDAAVYKYRTHTMQSGQYLYDASDTIRYPNGLVNTQPHASQLTPYTASWGKATQSRQKNAPKATNRNLFLSARSPAGTLITVNFGHDYNTEGFVRLVCMPNDQRGDQGTAHNGGRRYGTEVVGEGISVYWPLDQKWYDATLISYDHNGRHVMQYTDGMKESCHLHKQTFRWKGGAKVQQKLDKKKMEEWKKKGFKPGMTLVGGMEVKRNKRRGGNSNSTGNGTMMKKFKSSNGFSSSSSSSSSTSSSKSSSSPIRSFTLLQSRKKFQPILDQLIEMRWEILIDVTGGDPRAEELTGGDREQHVSFNPFFFNVTKEKIGSDGITKKSIEIQDAVSKNIARLDNEGKLKSPMNKKKQGKKKKGSKDPLKNWRLSSYFEIVHKPMSLQKMQRKLIANSKDVCYSNYEYFLNDVKQIVYNTKLYYSVNHSIHIAAVEMLRECECIVVLSKTGKLKKRKRTNEEKRKAEAKKIKKEVPEIERKTTGRQRSAVSVLNLS